MSPARREGARAPQPTVGGPPAQSLNDGPTMPDAFERLDEIAAALPSERWLLVGGLMVHAHARLAGVPHARPTDDADVVVELRAGSYAEAASTLEALGYRRKEPLDPRAPLHRFTRGAEVVDLMAPEGRQVHFGARTVLSVPQAWGYADPASRRRAVRTVLAIRPDWLVPEFVLPRRLGREL
jgi:hypothetical protein